MLNFKCGLQTVLLEYNRGMLSIDNLLVMQNGMRNLNQIPGMIDFVKSGGIWNSEALESYAKKHGLRVAPLMEIARFPDGKLMIHDGHHRGISVVLGGRKFIYPEEFVIVDWAYEDYVEINFDKRWVTPFDPRNFLRTPDIHVFKNKALDIAKTSREQAEKFIRENQNIYVVDRKINYIKELAYEYEKSYKFNN